jgi:hypothetical protein
MRPRSRPVAISAPRPPLGNPQNTVCLGLDFDMFGQHYLGEDLPQSGVELLLIDLGSAVALDVAALLV